MSDGMELQREGDGDYLPLVSALMPTANRRAFLPGAIRCFLAQTYPTRELVILDDGHEALGGDLESVVGMHRSIRYVCDRWAGRTLGDKRNALCSLAHGQILIHWDDDDWYAPERMQDQVDRLLSSGKGVTGYHRFFYWDEVGERAYEYQYTGAGHYASGSTQCYLRSWWENNHFPPVQSAEDSEFSFRAAKAGQLLSVPGASMMVARGHRRNTFKQPFGSHGFPPAATRELPAGFLAEIGVRA